jgi:hypothetical protein
MNISKANIIATLIHEEHGVSLDELISSSKKTPICYARVLFVSLLEYGTEFSSRGCADYLNRTIADINHIRRQHKAWLQVDRQYREHHNILRERYKSLIPQLNDIELAEVESELEHRLSITINQLIGVRAEMRVRALTINQSPAESKNG